VENFSPVSFDRTDGRTAEAAETRVKKRCQNTRCLRLVPRRFEVPDPDGGHLQVCWKCYRKQQISGSLPGAGE